MAAGLPACGSTAEALAAFDRLPPVMPEALRGFWHGASFASGHPLDGVLERFGWHGKRFDGDEAVHPLVFRAGGRTFTLQAHRLWPFVPALLRVPALRAEGVARLARNCLPLFAGASSGARLRRMEHRGVLTTALVYDRVPIVDVLRRADADRVLGLMDLKGMERPYFFLLQRVAE